MATPNLSFPVVDVDDHLVGKLGVRTSIPMVLSAILYTCMAGISWALYAVVRGYNVPDLISGEKTINTAGILIMIGFFVFLVPLFIITFCIDDPLSNAFIPLMIVLILSSMLLTGVAVLLLIVRYAAKNASLQPKQVEILQRLMGMLAGSFSVILVYALIVMGSRYGIGEAAARNV
jgi:hypothetical protein